MKKEILDSLVRVRALRPRQLDRERVKSILKSSETNVLVTKTIPLSEESSTLIFREIYESIRQLGEVKWWLLGYEPNNHEISLDILKEINIKEKIKLNSLERFKKIRHDANYRGLMVSVLQANEIIEFWNKCGIEILKILKKET